MNTKSSTRPSKVEKLHAVLSDGHWHTTKELVRRVGHSFSCAKFRLVQYGHRIEKRRHATRKWQWEYRLRD